MEGINHMNETKLFCWFCGNDKVKASILLVDNPKRPVIMLYCGFKDCEDGSQGLVSFGTTKEAIKFFEDGMKFREKMKDRA